MIIVTVTAATHSVFIHNPGVFVLYQALLGTRCLCLTDTIMQCEKHNVATGLSHMVTKTEVTHIHTPLHRVTHREIPTSVVIENDTRSPTHRAVTQDTHVELNLYMVTVSNIHYTRYTPHTETPAPLTPHTMHRSASPSAPRPPLHSLSPQPHKGPAFYRLPAETTTPGVPQGGLAGERGKRARDFRGTVV